MIPMDPSPWLAGRSREPSTLRVPWSHCLALPIAVPSARARSGSSLRLPVQRLHLPATWREQPAFQGGGEFCRPVWRAGDSSPLLQTGTPEACRLLAQHAGRGPGLASSPPCFFSPGALITSMFICADTLNFIRSFAAPESECPSFICISAFYLIAQAAPGALASLPT